MGNTFFWKPTLFTITNSIFSVSVILGISNFQIDGHDFVVSGCEDRSFKILDMKTGMSFLSQFL